MQGGDGADLRLHLRNDTVEETIEIADHIDSSGNNFLRLDRSTMPSAFQDIFTGYSQGDRLGVAFTRAIVVVPNEIAASFDAAPATFISVAEAVPSNELTGSFDAAPATFTGVAEAQPYGELVSSYEAGAATFIGVAEAQPYGELVGSFDAGVAEFTGVAEADPDAGSTTNTQTINLGTITSDGWEGAVLIDPALVVGGVTAYLRFLSVVGSSPQLRISATTTGDPTDPGPELTEALETYETAITLSRPGADNLVLKGPNHPDNSFSDATEPYFWTPDNFSAVSAWWTAAIESGEDITFRFDDGVSLIEASELEGSFDATPATFTSVAEAATLPNAVAPTVTIAPIGFIYADDPVTLQASVVGGTYDSLSYAWEIVSGAGSLSGVGDSRLYTPVGSETPEVRVTVTATGDGTTALDGTSDTDTDTETFTVRTAITLASISTAGRAIEAAAVIERSTEDTSAELYLGPDRGGIDVPIHGELGLGDGETVISRIRLMADFLVINDNDSPEALVLSTFFGAGGDGADLRWHLRNDTTEATIEIADHIDSSGGNFCTYLTHLSTTSL